MSLGRCRHFRITRGDALILSASSHLYGLLHHGQHTLLQASTDRLASGATFGGGVEEQVQKIAPRT